MTEKILLTSRDCVDKHPIDLLPVQGLLDHEHSELFTCAMCRAVPEVLCGEDHTKSKLRTRQHLTTKSAFGNSP